MSVSPATDDTNLKFAKKTLQDYEVISIIGNGSFGTCFKVRDKETGELFAWKGIDYDELSESKKQSLVSEISMLRQLQHPNIVQYYHHLVNYEAKSIFIVMECCEGGDLAQLIAKARLERKRFEEKYVWRVLFQVCKALQVCHNKIKEGTILHRDIKPANIFLDSDGNAKLGDFGLARMLRRNQRFAETFVGTPYYMSPEIVKGSKYDRKSDVWAMGCLVYEMCAMRPPFRGREFGQLSNNISSGKFQCLPDVYSTDLKEIIAFMLEVDNVLRPSIEMVTRNPIVIRNINDLGNKFPILIEAESGFYDDSDSAARCKLQYSPLTNLSSSLYSEQNSFNEGYGQRRLSLSRVFTPDLRAELFYSAKKKILHSNPELYESVKNDGYAVINDVHCSPNVITQNVLEDFLQRRLHAIRAEEARLKERQSTLDMRERELNEQQKRLQGLEEQLRTRETVLEVKIKLLDQKTAELTNAEQRMRTTTEPGPPPIPPRRPKSHDDTYCSIETNDSVVQEPTVAKLDLASLPGPKPFPTLRKVTFQSPQKFIKYDIENAVPKTDQRSVAKTNASHSTANQMLGSVSSKTSDESNEGSTHRRKSIFSIFSLNRHKESAPKAAATVTVAPVPKQRLPFKPKADQVLAKCEASELSSIWTREHKRAAFDLLAAMNAAEQKGNTSRSSSQLGRHKLRQSVRERNTLHRNRFRRSLIVQPTQPQVSCAVTRDTILV